MPIQVAYVPASKSCPYTHNKFWLPCQVLVRNTKIWAHDMHLSILTFKSTFSRFWQIWSQRVKCLVTKCSNSHWTQNSVWIGLWNAKLNFDAMINRNALPSDMRTIRGSQAFKVSITILTHASSKWSFSSEGAGDWTRNRRRKGNLSCKGGSRCGRESNFLTVFIELRCLSGHSVLCVCYSATLSCSFLTMMVRCASTVFLPRLARQGVN